MKSWCCMQVSKLSESDVRVKVPELEDADGKFCKYESHPRAILFMKVGLCVIQF